MSPDKKKLDPRILIPVALLAASAVTAWKLAHRGPFRYAGTVEATRVDLPARVASVVDTLLVQEGDKVRKGQKVAGLACEEIRVAARNVDENYARARKLRAAGSISQETFDQAETRKRDSDVRLSWCDVQSPINGTVLTRYLEPGEWVNPGVKLLSVADVTDAWAYVYVPQAVMARLKPGMAVTGLVSDLDDRKFPGVIRKINDEAEFTPKNVQTQAERTRLIFGIKIAFENPEEALKPGMTVEVTLQDAHRD